MPLLWSTRLRPAWIRHGEARGRGTCNDWRKSDNISMRGGEKYSTQSSEILKRLFFCTHTFGERSAPFDSLLRSTIRWRAAHASRHAPTHSVVSTRSRCRGAGRITAQVTPMYWHAGMHYVIFLLPRSSLVPIYTMWCVCTNNNNNNCCCYIMEGARWLSNCVERLGWNWRYI